MLFADGVNSRPASASVSPISTPPSSAPGIEPSPPVMTMTKASSVIGGPKRRRDVDDQHQHRAGRADAGGAEPEGQRIEPLDVEPDHQRAGVVVGAGADRLADRREAEEREQRRGDQNGRAAGIDLGGVDDQRPDREAVERIGRLHVAGVGPEDDQQAR